MKRCKDTFCNPDKVKQNKNAPVISLSALKEKMAINPDSLTKEENNKIQEFMQRAHHPPEIKKYKTYSSEPVRL